MIVERTENPQWLSNAYLVADPERGTGVLIDGNEDIDPLIDIAEREGIEITHSSSPTRTSTTSPGSPRRASGSASRRWSPTRRPRRSSTTRSR